MLAIKYLKVFCNLTPFAKFVMFWKAYNSSSKWHDRSIKNGYVYINYYAQPNTNWAINYCLICITFHFKGILGLCCSRKLTCFDFKVGVVHKRQLWCIFKRSILSQSKQNVIRSWIFIIISDYESTTKF